MSQIRLYSASISLLLLGLACASGTARREPTVTLSSELADSGTAPTSEDSVSPDAGRLFGALPDVAVDSGAVEPEVEVDTDTASEDNPLVACETAVALGGEPMIDDFEDGDLFPLVVDNRDGGWFVYDDTSGDGPPTLEFSTESVASDSSELALHIAGGPYAEYSGLGMGLRWTETGAEYCYYDASYYDGVTFWARTDSALRVVFQNPSVRPVSIGGGCPDDAGCFDSHGFSLPATEEWTQFELPFSDAQQAGWGYAAGDFRPEEFFVLEFQFEAGQAYEVWLDDVAFYKNESAAPSDAGSDAGVEVRPDAAIQVSGDAGRDAGGELDASVAAQAD